MVDPAKAQKERDEYARRVMQAIGTEDRKAAAYSLEGALGVSYTAARKTVDAKSILTAKNNSIAARCYKVNSDWLATGEGEMRAGVTLAPAPPPTLADALPVVLGALPGLDSYRAGQVLHALESATGSNPPLDAIERDVLRWLTEVRDESASRKRSFGA